MFMEPEITVKQRGWRIETKQGSTFLPGSVVDPPAYIKTGKVIDEGDLGFTEIADEVSAYTDGGKVLEVEVVEGYFYRLSAPGYLDCTDWSVARTLKEAKDDLKEQFS